MQHTTLLEQVARGRSPKIYVVDPGNVTYLFAGHALPSVYRGGIDLANYLAGNIFILKDADTPIVHILGMNHLYKGLLLTEQTAVTTSFAEHEWHIVKLLKERGMAANRDIDAYLAIAREMGTMRRAS